MDLKRAEELLAGLADGVDPLTGEILPEDCVCNHPEIVRAFHCILTDLSRRKRKPQPENAGKPWTAEEEQELLEMFDRGCSRAEMCRRFKRTDGALVECLVRLGRLEERQSFFRKRP